MGTVFTEVQNRLQDLIARYKKNLEQIKSKIEEVDPSMISDLKYDQIQISDAIMQHEKRLAILNKIEKNKAISPAEQRLLLNFESLPEVENYKKVTTPRSKQKL